MSVYPLDTLFAFVALVLIGGLALACATDRSRSPYGPMDYLVLLVGSVIMVVFAAIIAGAAFKGLHG